MYTWIWHRLPGGPAAKALGALILFLIVCAVLLFIVFPRVEPLLPFANVTVG
jgi:hypothetical protein